MLLSLNFVKFFCVKFTQNISVQKLALKKLSKFFLLFFTVSVLGFCAFGLMFILNLSSILWVKPEVDKVHNFLI